MCLLTISRISTWIRRVSGYSANEVKDAENKVNGGVRKDVNFVRLKVRRKSVNENLNMMQTIGGGT